MQVELSLTSIAHLNCCEQYRVKSSKQSAVQAFQKVTFVALIFVTNQVRKHKFYCKAADKTPNLQVKRLTLKLVSQNAHQ